MFSSIEHDALYIADSNYQMNELINRIKERESLKLYGFLQLENNGVRTDCL